MGSAGSSSLDDFANATKHNFGLGFFSLGGTRRKQLSDSYLQGTGLRLEPGSPPA